MSHPDQQDITLTHLPRVDDLPATKATVPSRPVRAAIVVTGDVSLVHHEAIRAIEGAELVGVADSNPVALARATDVTGVPGFTTHGELFDKVRPDVVHVCTPHDQHVAVSLDALAAGIHVLQEKPVAHTLEEAQRLVDAAAALPAGGPKIGICFQNRYNVSSQEAHRLLDQRAIGHIQGAWASVVWARTSAYYHAKPWRGTWERAGGGLLINQAIHTLDLIQWLMGDVVEVNGRAFTRKLAEDIEVEDTAEALLTHADGTTTTFFATLTAPANQPVELTIQGSIGSLRIRDGLELSSPVAVRRFEERHAPSGGRSYWGVSHEILIRDFYAKLDDPEPFWISPAEALKAQRILHAIYRQSPDLAR